MDWFKVYHGNKRDNKRRNTKKDLDTKLLNQEIDDKNQQFHKRLEALQDKYNLLSLMVTCTCIVCRYSLYAAQNQIAQPDVQKKGYIFYPGKEHCWVTVVSLGVLLGMESPGKLIMKAPSYRGHIEVCTPAV